jgi:hypothetical protein
MNEIKDPKANSGHRSTLSEKVKAAKSIVNLFKVERFVFVICALATFGTLLYLGVQHYKKHDDWLLFAGLFVPTGGIIFCCRQILGMFNQTLEFLKTVE